MATVLVALDAVDVAMTEAAVGAGISTVLFLAALYLGKSEEAKPAHRPLIPLALAISTGAVLVYGSFGLPAFSDPEAPIHTHVVPRYLHDGPRETGVPNVVTVVLASYRGFDTFGEITVVFTAGVGRGGLAAATQERVINHEAATGSARHCQAVDSLHPAFRPVRPVSRGLWSRRWLSGGRHTCYGDDFLCADLWPGKGAQSGSRPLRGNLDGLRRADLWRCRPRRHVAGRQFP